MVRLPVDRSDLLLPRTSTPKLPYYKHPIYKERKWLIVIAIIGIVLSLFSYSPWSSGAILGFSILFLALSIFAASADLTAYAMEKVQHPDKDPEWPRKVTMAFDLALAMLLQFTFWGSVAFFMEPFNYREVWILGAYAALADFVCSLIHAYSFWKQLMACYKEKWLASLAQEPCARCGYLEVPGETSSAPHAPCTPHNTFTYAGPSAAPTSSTMITPESTGINVEEDLLSGADFQYRDEPAEEPVPKIDQAERVVTSKGKKKKAASKSLPMVEDQEEE